MATINSHPRKPVSFWARRGLLYLALAVGSLLMLFPFYWAISNSLKLEEFIYASPPQWWPTPVTLKHYQAVFTQIPFLGFFANSLIVSLAITLGNVFFDTLAAYAFAKLKFPGRDGI